MDKTLQELQSFVTEVNKSNSSIDKLSVIRNFPQCQEMWKFVYDNINYQYGVTSDNVLKLKGKLSIGWSDKAFENIQSLLNALNNRTITGHDAVRSVLSYIEENKQYEELILNVIDRNLKTRTDAKLINKAFPGCIPQFEVALANDLSEYDPGHKKINFKKDAWYSSRKLDGCRCVCIVKKGSVKIYSRNGKEFLTLEKVKEQIRLLQLENIVFDGEICLVDDNGNEHFQEVMKEIRRKDHTIQNPRYKIFDCIPLNEFEKQEGNTLFWDRQGNLARILKNSVLSVHSVIGQVSQLKIESWDHLEELRQQALTSNWEGLIIRKNCFYEGKRSNNMLKVKYFKDAEFVIKDIEMGPIRYIDYDKNGKSFEKEETMLSAIMFEYKNNIVRCGSGFSLDERKYYFKNPQELIGKQVTVKYFEETKNQEGGESIRFPTVKKIWTNDSRQEEE